MYDPEFEKKVQQKMEELKFSPSASVWDRVEKELVRDKRRRSPIFWILPLLFLAASGGIYYYFHENNSHSASASKNTKLPTVQKDKSISTGQDQGADRNSSSPQANKTNGQDKMMKEKNELSSKHSKNQILAV